MERGHLAWPRFREAIMYGEWMQFVTISYGVFAAVFFVSAAISLKYRNFFIDLELTRNKRINYNFWFYLFGGLLYSWLYRSPTFSTLVVGYIFCIAFVWFVIRLIRKERSKGRKPGNDETE